MPAATHQPGPRPDPRSESRGRLEALRRLLAQGGRAGALSTQEELVEKLERLAFSVTQSTVSRDLRKLGAVRAVAADGRTVYRLPDEAVAGPVPAASLRDHVVAINTNGSLIAIRTSPGSASLVARHLDYSLPNDILGTIAGDDTIFVAPASLRTVRRTIERIERALS